MLIEDRNDSALGRNVEPTKALIKCEHVRVSPNRMNSRHFLRFKIKDYQFRILLTGNKCQPMFAVNQQTVWFAASGYFIARDYLVFGWINFCELILTVHRDKDVFRN